MPTTLQAYGPSGLGIATVSGVPGYEQLRQGLLPLAAKLAALPQATLSALEDPGSRFSFGWSCGRETLEGGQPDTRKGSFYANPLHDDPSCGDADLQRRFPSYCRPNMWPRSELPVLEAAFKALGRLILNVGLLLAGHADKYVASKAGYPPRLHDILRQSPCPKGEVETEIPVCEGGPPLPASAALFGRLAVDCHRRCLLLMLVMRLQFPECPCHWPSPYPSPSLPLPCRPLAALLCPGCHGWNQPCAQLQHRCQLVRLAHRPRQPDGAVQRIVHRHGGATGSLPRPAVGAARQGPLRSVCDGTAAACADSRVARLPS